MASPTETAVVIDGYYLYRSLVDLMVTDLESAVWKVVLYIQEKIRGLTVLNGGSPLVHAMRW